MASIIRVEPSREEDVPRIMQFLIPAFEHLHYSQLVGDTNTPENLEAAGQRHLHAWQEHAKHFKNPMGIKCVHTDPATGKETIVSTAEWVIYDHERPEQEYLQPNYLLSASWVTDDKTREEAVQWIKPVVDSRIRWFAGRPYAALLYMTTDSAFQRQGAASKCVQWGLDRCAELGIPAYLEASDAGAPVYTRLGFEIMDRVPVVGGIVSEPRTIPAMIWWPPGTKDEDKKPALPGYGLEKEASTGSSGSSTQATTQSIHD